MSFIKANRNLLNAGYVLENKSRGHKRVILLVCNFHLIN